MIYHAIDRQAISTVCRSATARSAPYDRRRRPTRVVDPRSRRRGLEYDPAKATQLLDEAGYLDTDGDGCARCPTAASRSGSHKPRSESENADSIRAFVTEFDAVGIATDVEVMDDTQLYEAQVAGEYDIFVWGWTP
ncbi:MAG: ABC transporter substrate-binding protein [Ilumatobacteraceae bacterium]